MKFRSKYIKELETENEGLKAKITRLEDKLEVYKHVEDKIGTVDVKLSGISGTISTAELKLGDDVARFVDDYYGGQVIQQEATSVTVLDKSGKATYHKTKTIPDKGYNYKLERL